MLMILMTSAFSGCVADYAARSDRLSEAERRQALAAIGRLRAAKPARTAAAVDDELRRVRAARRAGGRRHRGE